MGLWTGLGWLRIETVSCGWSTPRPGRFSPRKVTRYPLYRRLGGPHDQSGRVLDISPPTRNLFKQSPRQVRYID